MRLCFALRGRVTSDRIIDRMPRYKSQSNGGANVSLRFPSTPWGVGCSIHKGLSASNLATGSGPHR